MAIRIQKYGGSSLANLERIETVADFLAHCHRRGGEQVVAVVSAMGDQTDELLGMARRLSPNPPKREVDMLLSAGERISMALLAVALHRRGIPASSFTGSQVGIVTDEEFGSARISHITGARIRDCLDQGQIAIVAGFQGVSSETKNITTLGRGGTDLTAVALGVCLGARAVELFKDVPGIYPVDPRQRSGLRVLKGIAWADMKRLADCGAQVIQSRAIMLAMKYELPVIVRSSFDFAAEGTVVAGHHRNMERSHLVGVTHAGRMRILSVRLPLGGNARDAAFAVARFCKSEDTRPALLAVSGPQPTGSELTVAVKAGHEQAMLEAVGACPGGEPVVLSARDCMVVTAVGCGFLQADQVGWALIGAVPPDCLHLTVQDEMIQAYCREEQGEVLLAKWSELIGQEA